MAEPAEQSAERRALARRRAVDTLRIASAVASYAAEVAGNGVGPEEARQAVVEAAAELELAAVQLRRLAVRLSPVDVASRRALAVQLTEAGVTQRQAAAVVGVSPRRVWDYLAGRSLVRSACPRLARGAIGLVDDGSWVAGGAVEIGCTAPAGASRKEPPR